ncbi:MAG: flagellar biosynthesis anti-sigma factor FlgM [Parasphingorhabdus sp.]|uniref:flagellar biosynthesis anti-sigma factor FlgM n=1 Tax=Parasphingorhabdus sp. TaxID=2709688 RepID=UPI0032656C79
MKPVDSYSAINARLDRPAPNDAAAKNAKGDAGAEKTEMPSAISMTAAQLERAAAAETAKSAANAEKASASVAISTTASQLATEKPPFDAQKVSDIKQQIASGNYKVDTDKLAEKMLDSGVLGVDSKQ